MTGFTDPAVERSIDLRCSADHASTAFTAFTAFTDQTASSLTPHLNSKLQLHR